MAIQKTITLLSRWAPPILWAAFIFFLSTYNTLPGPQIIWWDFIFKKSAHMGVYAVLYFLVYRAINFEAKTKNAFIPMLFTIAYAFTDEYHQSFIVGRTALLSDIGYDFIGASLTMLKLKKLI